MSSRPLFLLVLGLMLALGAAQAWWLARAVARRVQGWMSQAPVGAGHAGPAARMTQYGVFAVQFAAYAYAAYVLAPLVEQFLVGAAR